MNRLDLHASTGIVSEEMLLAHLAEAIDASDDPIVSKSIEGVIQCCNPATERVFGYSADELIGRPVTVLIPPERQSEEREILDRIRSGERVEHFETVRLTKDGRRIDVSLTISPIRDATGAIIGASKIARDITERRRAHAAHAHLAAIIESSDDAIISKDLS